MNPLVSVLFPVYNAAATLPAALDSMLRQSLRAIEIVAVDDGSKDRSPEILERFARDDERVHPVLTEHRGLIPALNLTLARANGALVARMDADDVSHPDRLGKQAALLQERQDVSVVGSLVRSFPGNEVRQGYRIYETWLNRLTTHEEIVREIFIESPLVHPSVMMRREELTALGGYQDRGWAEDYDLWLRYYLAGKRFAKVAEVLHFWREREDRLTRTDPRYSVENFLRAKAFYLLGGPLRDRDSVMVWGAGKTGRRISKHLQRGGASLVAFVDVDARKIGTSVRGVPVVGPDELLRVWANNARPVLLSAVSSRGARGRIRTWLDQAGLNEGEDFLCVA